MTSRLKTAAVAGALVVPLVASGFMLQSRQSRDGARLFDQVMTLVSDRFVDTLANGDLYEKAARGLVREIQDPYAALYSPKQLQEFTATTGGRYGGLGMLVEDQQGTAVVNRVYPHTPAEGAGVREGDHIVAVEGKSVRGWKLPQITDALKGTPGTTVTVSFARSGVATPLSLKFTRAVIHIPAIPYAMMLDGNVGYIPVLQYNETAAAEFETAVRRLTAQGARGLVIDLRGNGGGIVDQAVAMTNLFLRDGQEIASVRSRGGDVQRYIARGKTLAPSVPLVILTDGYTASASEIMAGALQDHDRALVVGTTSFGKGLVQSLFQLDGGYALKLTTAKWYTPSGRSIQKDRKYENGQLIDMPDSLESDTVKAHRPAYKSDAGRIVYGGGGITPDVLVRPDTLTTAEQDFMKAVTPKSQEFYVTLYNYTMALKDSVRPDFSVQPTWRDEFYRRLGAAGVPVDRKMYDGARAQVDRILANRIARFAFGDSTAKRREIPDDAQLRRALDIVRRGETQHDLFVTAQRQ